MVLGWCGWEVGWLRRSEICLRFLFVLEGGRGGGGELGLLTCHLFF